MKEGKSHKLTSKGQYPKPMSDQILSEDTSEDKYPPLWEEGPQISESLMMMRYMKNDNRLTPNGQYLLLRGQIFSNDNSEDKGSALWGRKITNFSWGPFDETCGGN